MVGQFSRTAYGALDTNGEQSCDVVVGEEGNVPISLHSNIDKRGAVSTFLSLIVITNCYSSRNVRLKNTVRNIIVLMSFLRTKIL